MPVAGRAARQPQAFSTAVSGNASARITQHGRTPNTIAANAATAPVASVHISQPKADVKAAMTRAVPERGRFAAVGADSGFGESSTRTRRQG